MRQSIRQAAPIRVLAIFGTRPEAIKLFPLVHALREDERFVARVCVSGQHREMLDQVLELARIRPDHDLDLMREGQSLDSLTARLVTGIGEVLDIERPDCVVVQGDTSTAMAGGLAAHYRKLPVMHVEAGLRSGNIHHPWPEEANRRIISAFAALHFAPTQAAAAALRAENVDPASIHVTGNTGIDALRWITGRIGREPALAGRMGELAARFEGRRIIGVTSHRRENWGDGMAAIANAVARLAGRGDIGVIFPVHPNPQIGQVMRRHLGEHRDIALCEPLSYPDFARLMAVSHVMLTDSGGVQEEAPGLGTPVLVMRETTERAEGIEAGTARLVGTDAERIVAEAERLLDDPAAHASMARAVNPYGDGHAAGRIVDALVAHFGATPRTALGEPAESP